MTSSIRLVTNQGPAVRLRAQVQKFFLSFFSLENSPFDLPSLGRDAMRNGCKSD